MANKHVRVIGDLGRFDLDWALGCPRCGREVAFAGQHLLNYFVDRRWALTLPIDVSRFRCVCGARGGDASLVMTSMRPDPLPRPPTTLAPLYVRQPSALEVIADAAAIAVNRQVQSPELAAALERIEPHVEQTALREFWLAAGSADPEVRPQRCRAALREISRQLRRG